jgi:AraC family transcriptional regulator of adaptative response / DNA-3-methyladenine glycosylase II
VISTTAALRFQPPLTADNLIGHLTATAVPGVEEWRDGFYRRTTRFAGGPAIIAVRPAGEKIDARLWLSDRDDRPEAIDACRWLLDLDADPAVIDGSLRADPLLAPLVDRAPGRRVPRALGVPEFTVRAVIGQQVSTAAARTHAGRLVLAHGVPIEDPSGGLTHLFPEPQRLATIDPQELAMPKTRRATLVHLFGALASGELALTRDSPPAEARAALAALPGFGPWTVESVMMRALGDPDAFPGSDLGIVKAAHAIGLPATPGGLRGAAEAWRPWRAYAVQHLWATGDHAINRLPR